MKELESQEWLSKCDHGYKDLPYVYMKSMNKCLLTDDPPNCQVNLDSLETISTNLQFTTNLTILY